MPANPEAIAWYLTRSEALLGDHLDRIESLRGRGDKLAGFSGAILALAGANANSILVALHGAARVGAGIALVFGCLLLIVASVTALSGALVPQVPSVVTAEEVANYATERFVEEPDLWRVHLVGIALGILVVTVTF